MNFMMIKVRILNPWVKGWTMVNIMMSQQIWGYTMSETTQRMAQGPSLSSSGVMPTLPTATPMHRTFFSWNFTCWSTGRTGWWDMWLQTSVVISVVYLTLSYDILRIGERMWKVYVSNPPSPVGLSPTEIDSGDSRRHTSLNPAGGTWLRTSVTLVSRLSECCTRVGNLPACRARVILERSRKGEQWAKSGKEMQRASKSMLSYPFHQLEDGCFLFPRNHPFQVSSDFAWIYHAWHGYELGQVQRRINILRLCLVQTRAKQSRNLWDEHLRVRSDLLGLLKNS